MAKAKAKVDEKSVWPNGHSTEDVSRALAKAAFLANHAAGNIGDSLESRLTTMFLGGGSDFYDGGLGYNGEFLGQSVYEGEESTQRGAPALSPISRATVGKQDETKLAWLKMNMANNVYDNDGQVSSIVDLMSDFASEGIKFVHSSDSVQKFYDSWSQKVKLKSRFRNAITQLIVSGSVFFYRVFAKINAEEETAMKTFTIGRSIGEKFVITDDKGEETLVDPKIEYDSSVRFVIEAGLGDKITDDGVKEQVKAFVINKLQNNGAKIIDTEIKPGAANVIPWKYVMINPLQVIPDGDGWTFLLTKDDVLKLLNKSSISYEETTQAIKVTLPEGVNGTIKKTKHPGFYAEMPLDSNRLIVLQYNKSDWKKWASGLVWKAMPTITFKNTLRQMEIKTAKAAINTVILWQLGDHKEGLMPNLEDYERLADMLKAPASTLNVIWNSAIKADVIQPKLSEVFDVKRWEELRKEVTAQFGITQAVVTGEGGNFSSSFISVQGLLEKLETLRDIMIESWIMEEVFIINKALGFRKLPKVHFNEMSLRDETAANNFTMALYDRGLISDQTLYDTLEKDAEIERERLLNEKKWETDNDFERRGPFIKVPEQDQFDNKQLEQNTKMQEKDHELQREQMDHDKKLNETKLKEDIKIKKTKLKQDMKLKKQALKQRKLNGRPPGSKKPQTKKRVSKPKNAASLQDVEKIIDLLDTKTKDYIKSKAGVSDYRSLSKEDKDKVPDYVGIALALLDDMGLDKVTDLSVVQAESMKYATSEFAAVLPTKITEFIAKNARKPTRDELYKIYAETYLDS